jgi:hypothetical protein
LATGVLQESGAALAVWNRLKWMVTGIILRWVGVKHRALFFDLAIIKITN